MTSKRKWTGREYHVQYNADVSHKDVKMYCDTNQFPALPFCGPHPKPHGARGLSKHYNLRFDPKLGHGICGICCIPLGGTAQYFSIFGENPISKNLEIGPTILDI